jgi:uncharacterized protein (DUF2141 family)
MERGRAMSLFRSLPLSCVIGAVAALGAAPAPAGDTGKLTVRFSGLEEKRGEVLFSVADSEKTFEADREAFRGARLIADGDTAVAVFENLPRGEYAIKVFHDTNGNEKLDIGFMGPKEKYGFSNNVMGFMGPPSFDDAKFAFDGGELTVEIEAR